jgi:hypothetical protein
MRRGYYVVWFRGCDDQLRETILATVKHRGDSAQRGSLLVLYSVSVVAYEQLRQARNEGKIPQFDWVGAKTLTAQRVLREVGL